MATKLKRIDLPVPSKVSEETKQVAREALVILKYRELFAQTSDGQESLSSVLRRLNIKPFDPNTVNKYQTEKRVEARESSKNKDYFYWRKIQLRDAHNVPIFVLRKAIQIKLACPDVKLFVEYLEEHPDPFLRAQLGRDDFYIDVWDEKDFEAKL